MKKTLLAVAASLAVGAISSQAAPVYSQNIVGYVNQTLVGGFNMVVPPLSASGSNTMSAEAVFPCLASGDQLYIWKADGSGFNIAYFNGIGDWYDGLSFAAIPVPSLKMGGGVYYQNNNAQVTNTYVGTVLLTNSITLVGGFTMTGSTPPVAGSAETLGLPLVSGDQLYLWKTDGSGFTIAYFNGIGDWYDGLSFAAIPVPNVTVGYGFYYQNNNAPSVWNQNLVLP